MVIRGITVTGLLAGGYPVMPGKRKLEVVSFKAEAPLVEALEAMPNRSEFIRAALISALDGACPLCGGSGLLTKEQRLHWESFIKDHKVKRCGECKGLTISCGH
jgi:hypothetical protein